MSVPKNQQQVIEFVDLATISDGLLKFPRLYIITNTGKIRNWDLFVGIYNTSTNEKITVDNNYIMRSELPDNCAGMYWTEYGLEGGRVTVTKPTYVKVGKSLKANNYTTPFTQAILDAKSDYEHKIKKGASTDRDELLTNNDNKTPTIPELMMRENRGNYPWRVYPMAMHDLKKDNNWGKIKYPCKMQYKMDGTFCLILHHPALPLMDVGAEKLHLDSYTRGMENSENIPYILLEIYPILQKYPGLHLVGELWKSGYSLQDLSGASRRLADSKVKTDAVQMEFNIFDCFYLDIPMSFEERLAILDDINDELIAATRAKYNKIVPTYDAADKVAVMKLYDDFIKQGYEGAVIRNADAPYEYGINKELRSYNTMKLKPRYDEEFPIVGFVEGTAGKEVGAVIWVCCENDAGVKKRTNELLPLNQRKTFNFTPNMNYEERYKIYKYLHNNPDYFKNNLYGKEYTINYSVLSKDGLPQQPKGKSFREQKLNEDLLKISD